MNFYIFGLKNIQSYNLSTNSVQIQMNYGLVVGQEKDVSLFLDRTGEPATQHQGCVSISSADEDFME